MLVSSNLNLFDTKYTTTWSDNFLDLVVQFQNATILFARCVANFRILSLRAIKHTVIGLICERVANCSPSFVFAIPMALN